jgi:RHS repeat-associated protein
VRLSAAPKWSLICYLQYVNIKILTGTRLEAWTYDYQDGEIPAAGKCINKMLHTDFKQGQIVSSYDVMGRLKEKKQGTTTLADYRYTATGQRERMRDNFTLSGGPRHTRYVYDERQRLRIKDTPEGALTYGYHGDAGTDLNIGDLKSISARLSYTYPTDPPYAWAGPGGGNESNPNGALMTYAYDSRHRLKQVNPDVSGGNADAAYLYDPVGNLQRVTYRNGIQTDYTYNTRNQLTVAAATHGASVVASFKYDDSSWNTARRLAFSGQRRRLEETINGNNRTVEYDYDTLRRLTKENVLAGSVTGTVTYDAVPGYGDTTGYDPVGNRHSRNSTLSGVASRSYAAYDAKDRLGNTGTGLVRANFDANGNTLQFDLDANDPNGQYDQPVEDGYDAENHLTAATRTAGAITLIYDGDGNRVRKQVGNAQTWYLVDEQNPTGYAQVIEERVSTSEAPSLTMTPTVSYVYGLGLISQKRGTTVHYYGYDGQGSVRYLTGGNSDTGTYGQVTDTYTYDAFGIQIAPTDTTANNYRYTGQQWDDDLGLYYLRARYYNPQIGRFWTMDTFEGDNEDPQNLHKYLYCSADPVNGIDPSGNVLEGVEFGISLDALSSVEVNAAKGVLSVILWRSKSCISRLVKDLGTHLPYGLIWTPASKIYVGTWRR